MESKRPLGFNRANDVTALIAQSGKGLFQGPRLLRNKHSKLLTYRPTTHTDTDSERSIHVSATEPWPWDLDHLKARGTSNRSWTRLALSRQSLSCWEATAIREFLLQIFQTVTVLQQSWSSSWSVRALIWQPLVSPLESVIFLHIRVRLLFCCHHFFCLFVKERKLLRIVPLLQMFVVSQTSPNKDHRSTGSLTSGGRRLLSSARTDS